MKSGKIVAVALVLSIALAACGQQPPQTDDGSIKLNGDQIQLNDQKKEVVAAPGIGTGGAPSTPQQTKPAESSGFIGPFLGALAGSFLGNMSAQRQQQAPVALPQPASTYKPPVNAQRTTPNIAKPTTRPSQRQIAPKTYSRGPSFNTSRSSGSRR